MRLSIVPAILLTLCLILPAGAAVIRIPADQPTIQAGIELAVDGDTVLVADGTYTGDGNRDIDFLGKAITVISENGPENCVIDMEGLYPHRGFHFDSGEDEASVLEGFTITGGNTSWSGGAIKCRDTSPTIRRNIITGNTSWYEGGGIACYGGASPLIIGNLIEGNTVEAWYYEDGAGGGIHAASAAPRIRENIIRENFAIIGTGIYLHNCTGDLSGNTIVGNQFFSSWQVAAIHCRDSSTTIARNFIGGNYGNGIETLSSTISITGNTISGNEGTGIEYFHSVEGEVEISDNTIAGNEEGGLYVRLNSDGMAINNNRIIGNSAVDGAGLHIHSNVGDNPTLRLAGNLIKDNTARDFGGGLYCLEVSELFIEAGNVISGNQAQHGTGGGLYLAGCEIVVIDSCRVTGNEASQGGGIQFAGSLDTIATLSNLLVTGNYANRAGGIGAGSPHSLRIDGCTIARNGSAGTVGGIMVEGASEIDNAIVWENNGAALEGPLTVRYSDIDGGWAGTGNLDTDPLFADGPLGGFYLGQTAAGQPVDSPCVDTGDPETLVGTGTTRTDLESDTGVVDMGYHYPREAPESRLIFTGPGPGGFNPPLVRGLPPAGDADPVHEFLAYGVSRYGVNVTAGDVDGNLRDEVITGAGPGDVFGPHVRGFAADGALLPGLDYLAYGTHKYGVNVAAGDVDGDGIDEIITGAGPGAVFGPHVRGWDYDDGTVTPKADISFLAYGTPKWGVNVACGDIDGDGFDEIVTGAGPGAVYGPHVRGWDHDGTGTAAISGVSFLAYGTHKYGVRVSCGDVDNDGIDEIVTAPGPGDVFGTHIRGWNCDGGPAAPLPGLSFFAWGYPGASHGATIWAGTDLAGDTADDLLVGMGPDPEGDALVTLFLYDGSTVKRRFTLNAFPAMTHGTTVAAGNF